MIINTQQSIAYQPLITGVLLALSSSVAWAQTADSRFGPLPEETTIIEPSAAPAIEELPPDTRWENAPEQGLSPAPSVADEPLMVPITLAELISLAVAGNRDLRDRQLQRLIEQQQLEAAEARFDPRLTPEVGTGLNQQFDEGFSGGGILGSQFGSTSTEVSDRTTLSQSAGVLSEVTTRQGTDIGLSLDALGDPAVRLRLTQPLLRGAGNAINEAPVDIARLRESQNFYSLQQTLIDTVSSTVTQYTNLIQAQRSVAIQTEALRRRQEQLTIVEALVAAGRRAAFDLADSRRSVANAERDLILAQTDLAAANTALLDQVSTDADIRFTASAEIVADLFRAAVERTAEYDVETLLAIAYQTRPDYLQTVLDQDIAQLNRDLALDDLRWQLNVEGNANLGDFSETSLGLVARRTFDEPELETARVSSEVDILQQENRLAQQQVAIRNEITNRLNTVRANLVRVDAAQRATENAQRQLEATQQLFESGRAGGNLFQIITQEENLVEAQNQELFARIDFLNSVVDLDRAVGLTLETWSGQVDFLPALITPQSVDELTNPTPDFNQLTE
jgi:outer membrane protein TolC